MACVTHVMYHLLYFSFQILVSKQEFKMLIWVSITFLYYLSIGFSLIFIQSFDLAEFGQSCWDYMDMQVTWEDVHISHFLLMFILTVIHLWISTTRLITQRQFDVVWLMQIMHKLCKLASWIINVLWNMECPCMDVLLSSCSPQELIH